MEVDESIEWIKGDGKIKLNLKKKEKKLGRIYRVM